MSLTFDIDSLIPQRPPFKFIDKIIDLSSSTLLAEKKITGEEDFFKGHFPQIPIMPGVLLLEAMFQSAAAFIGINQTKKVKKAKENQIGVVVKIQNTRFKQMVRPGDTIQIFVEQTDSLDNLSYFNGKITLGNKLVANASFAVAMTTFQTP